MKKQLLFLSLAIFSSVVFAQVTTTGLIAKYYFNSGTAQDDINSNNGVVTGAVLTADRFGNPNAAYLFDGNDNINIPYFSALNVSTGLTISAWIKKDDNSSQQAIVARWKNVKSADQYLLMTSGNKALIATGNPSYSANGVSCTPSFNTGIWYHVVFEWKNNGDHKLFVNGVKTDSTRLASFATINAGTQNPLIIGAQYDGSYSRLFMGTIDDVRIYNRALSYTEIAALYTEEDFATSTSEITTNGFAIYPNPAKDILTVDLASLQNSLIKIYSLSGQLLLIKENASGNVQMDISGLSSGIYFTEVISGGAVSRKKIVIE